MVGAPVPLANRCAALGADILQASIAVVLHRFHVTDSGVAGFQ